MQHADAERATRLLGGASAAGGTPLWAAAAAEALATALLVALSCAAACARADRAERADPMYAALTAGLIVAMLVQCFDHISGAMMNPTVTLAAALRRRLAWRAAAAFALAQLAAAAAAPALLPLLARNAPAAPAAPAAANATRADHAACCLTLPADDFPPYKAAALEAVLGACLALANCASWDARNRLLPGSWPLRIGAVVAALTALGGELTGASVNPARSLGPALWAGDLRHQWVYWVGPLGGSLAASLLYGWLWPAPAAAPPRAYPGAGAATPHATPHAAPHPATGDVPPSARKQRPV